MIWEESFQNSLSKIRYLVCSFLCWTAERFLMWYQIVPIQNWQWTDQEVENLFYNILLVKGEKDSHKFEFLFADLMFSFTSICLDGTLTPSKTNHMFLLLIWLRRTLLPLLFVVALQYWRKVVCFTACLYANWHALVFVCLGFFPVCIPVYNSTGCCLCLS